MDANQRTELGDKLVWHSKGPMQTAESFNRYVTNGMLFRTLEHDNWRRSQNSGVSVSTIDGPTYYEKLTSIIELQYYDGTRYVLFKCDWADITINRGYKEDEFGIPLVNFNRLIHTGDRLNDDPFVLASQVSQVYYVEDVRHPNWLVVVKTKPRHVFDVGQGEGHDDDVGGYRENEPFNLNINQDPLGVSNDNVECARNDVEGIEVNNGAEFM